MKPKTYLKKNSTWILIVLVILIIIGGIIYLNSKSPNIIEKKYTCIITYSHPSPYYPEKGIMKEGVSLKECEQLKSEWDENVKKYNYTIEWSIHENNNK